MRLGQSQSDDHGFVRPLRIQRLPGISQRAEANTYADRADTDAYARIGIMRALNRHVERVFNPDRKDHHWGRRKLARDQ